MNLFTGIAVLLLAAYSFFKYRPASRGSRELCGLTALMGLLAAGAGTGSWKFQAIQTVLLAVVGVCCFVQLRRESILRARRARRRRLHRPQRQAHDQAQPARIA